LFLALLQRELAGYAASDREGLQLFDPSSKSSSLSRSTSVTGAGEVLFQPNNKHSHKAGLGRRRRYNYDYLNCQPPPLQPPQEEQL
jgi:hypothetical protein